jgi:hypothetical protein
VLTTQNNGTEWRFAIPPPGNHDDAHHGIGGVLTDTLIPQKLAEEGLESDDPYQSGEPGVSLADEKRQLYHESRQIRTPA